MSNDVEFFDPPPPPKTRGNRRTAARKQPASTRTVRRAHASASNDAPIQSGAAPTEDGSARVHPGPRTDYAPVPAPRELKTESKRREANVAPDRLDLREERKAGKGVPFKTDEDERLRLKLATYAPDNPNPASLRKLATIPGVNALSIATRYMDGGRDRFIEFVQIAHLNDMPNATNWLSVYSKLLPSERVRVNFDDICASSGVQPKNLMAEVVSAAMEIGQDVANLIAAATHPAVVSKLAESAQRINGKHTEVSHKDRIAFLQSAPVRFLPMAKNGSTVNVNTTASAAAAAAAAASEEPSVPSFAQDMERLAPVRQQAQREMGDPETPSFLDGEVAE